MKWQSIMAPIDARDKQTLKSVELTLSGTVTFRVHGNRIVYDFLPIGGVRYRMVQKDGWIDVQRTEDDLEAIHLKYEKIMQEQVTAKTEQYISYE